MSLLGSENIFTHSLVYKTRAIDFQNFVEQLMTRSSANAEEPCEHTVSLKSCKMPHKNIRRTGYYLFYLLCQSYTKYSKI